MSKTALIIGGVAVAVLGGGYYLYRKSTATVLHILYGEKATVEVAGKTFTIAPNQAISVKGGSITFDGDQVYYNEKPVRGNFFIKLF